MSLRKSDELSPSMRRQPVRTYADLHLDWDLQRNRRLHLFFDNGAHFFFLAGMEIEHQFVMHLEEHSRIEFSAEQLPVDGDHGEFDHIGGRSLNGRVDRVALGGVADGVTRSTRP